MLKPLAVFATFSLLALGCSDGSKTEEQASEIVDPNNSNIRSPSIGTITDLKVLPNTNVPRAVLVSLVDNTSTTNTSFVSELYEQILAVNDAEHLSGADGYSQQI